MRNFSKINPFVPETDHMIEPMLDLYTKRLRKIVLDRTILQKNKLIVPTVRLRQEDDTLEKLRNSKLCAAVINARDEFEDVDFVLQSRQVVLMRARKDANVMSYYLQFGDELIRCTLESVKQHHVHNWLIQAKFNRYIPGRPNPIYLPLKMTYNKENKFINKGADIAIKYDGLWFNSYNDEYPAAIEFDPKTANPAHGYRLGELANKLPDGLELHPKHKTQLHNYIVELKVTKDLELEKELEYLQFKKKLKEGETLADEDIKIDDFSDEEPEEKAEREAAKARREAKKAERREKAKKNPRSLKKQLAMMNFKVKEGLFVATDTKPQKKGGNKD